MLVIMSEVIIMTYTNSNGAAEMNKLNDKIEDAKAKIKKLTAQKRGIALSPDVAKQLKDAKAELAKLKKQKASGDDLYGE